MAAPARRTATSTPLVSISRSRLPVPRMPEEICTFLSFEGAGNQADSATKSFDCALGGLAQLRFHFAEALFLSLIHISEPTRQAEISYAVFCLKKKKKLT